MSSGVVKKTYNDIPKIELPIKFHFELDKKDGHIFKFQFISELVSMMFFQKNSNISFKNLSDLIILSLQAPENIFANILFSRKKGSNVSKNSSLTYFLNQKNNKNKEECLLLLNKIRSIFDKSPDLNNQQKLNYCSIERHFMKLFLKTCL
ncbi:MAG: hypothetical protein ACFFAO_07985 [Candidatus Hermodarchaeota archaeon]